MENAELMAVMIERCRDMILEHDEPRLDLPAPVRPRRLVAMCNRMTEHVDDWSPAKLNRWIGFIQCAMIANRMIDLDGAKGMFDQAKRAFGGASQDVLDHLDPAQSFELDIGGEG